MIKFLAVTAVIHTPCRMFYFDPVLYILKLTVSPTNLLEISYNIFLNNYLSIYNNVLGYIFKLSYLFHFRRIEVNRKWKSGCYD